MLLWRASELRSLAARARALHTMDEMSPAPPPAQVGANSYRTAHYPYSEADLELADRGGLLVISEAPTVGLSFHDTPEVLRARQLQSLRALRELLARDCCRTCVVGW